MRRLFSSFAHGRPGAGLLLMRLTAGIALIVRGVSDLLSGASLPQSLPAALALAAGLLLILGLWTPITGSVVAVLQSCAALSQTADPWTPILLAALGAGLALLGPGAWSIDARLFGWKRLDFRDRDI